MSFLIFWLLLPLTFLTLYTFCYKRGRSFQEEGGGGIVIMSLYHPLKVVLNVFFCIIRTTFI